MADIVEEARYMLGKYKAKVWPEFIVRRDRRVHEDLTSDRKKGIKSTKDEHLFRKDEEFPEYHQPTIDKNQTHAPEHEKRWDTEHATLGNLDYKQDAKNGVHVSQWIQKRIEEGNIDYLVIWKWLPFGQHNVLTEDSMVEYEIIAVVNAKEALELLKKSENNRFNWREVNERIS